MFPVFPLTHEYQKQVVAVPAVFCFMANVTVIFRGLARRVSHRSLNASDYIMIAALVSTWVYTAVTMAGAFTGAGVHMSELESQYGLAPITSFLKLGLAGQILWALSIGLCKLSILMLYSMVFTVRNFALAARGLAALVVLWAAATILTGVFICQPVALNWDTSLKGHCGVQTTSFKITASINILTDVLILLLPMPYLVKLQLPVREKVFLVGTFAVGFLTCIIGILRLASIMNIDYTDITYSDVVPEIYSNIEPCLAISCACVPTLRPLMHYTRHSNTGTALPGPRSSITRAHESSNRLERNSSELQLRPATFHHTTGVVAKNAMKGEGPESAGTEMDALGRGIHVRQQWDVDRE